MLTPAQVIPFLSAEDALLREQAANYFYHAADPAPLTADDCWSAAARVGLTRSELGLIRIAATVPQSDHATDQLLAALDEHADDELTDFFLDALEEIDFDQLRRHRDRIFARADLHEEVRANLEERLEIAQTPAAELWDRLFRFADETADQYWDQVKHDVSDRLIEALARHGQPAAELAMALLQDPATQSDPREVYAIQLLARTRHRPALDLLVRRFVECDEEDDVLHESLQDAIPRVGGPDAVAPIEALFPAQNWTFRNYASGLLLRIKHPAAEAALLRLINRPDVSDEDLPLIGYALASLCTTDGLPELRRIVIEKKYDPKVFDLKQDLVACALMANYDFPELPLLREEVVARHVEHRRKLESGEYDLRDLIDPLGDTFDGDDDGFDDYTYPELPENLDDRQPAPAPPIRNQAPKVGRNDPCPCGSGKKYKKCCLDKG